MEKKNQEIVNIFETARGLKMIFGIKIRISKFHHFAKFKQNRSKDMSPKLNFRQKVKNWFNSKMTGVGHYFKKFRNP